MCLAALEVPDLHRTEQVVTILAQSRIDLGFATVSQDNSEAGLVFGKIAGMHLGGAHHVMWQFSSPFGFLKKVPCSELLL